MTIWRTFCGKCNLLWLLIITSMKTNLEDVVMGCDGVNSVHCVGYLCRTRFTQNRSTLRIAHSTSSTNKLNQTPTAPACPVGTEPPCNNENLQETHVNISPKYFSLLRKNPLRLGAFIISLEIYVQYPAVLEPYVMESWKEGRNIEAGDVLRRSTSFNRTSFSGPPFTLKDTGRTEWRFPFEVEVTEPRLQRIPCVVWWCALEIRGLSVIAYRSGARNGLFDLLRHFTTKRNGER